jgi:hypothetical protein
MNDIGMSVIMPVSFAVPLTLYTGISLVRGHVGMLLNIAHLMSMKQPVALQSMRACVHHLTVVSIDSISTSTARDIGPGLAATIYLMGN